MLFNLLTALVYVVGGTVFFVLIVGCIVTDLYMFVVIVRWLIWLVTAPIRWVIEKVGNK